MDLDPTLTHSQFTFPSYPQHQFQDLDVATWALIHSSFSFCSLFKGPKLYVPYRWSRLSHGCKELHFSLFFFPEFDIFTHFWYAIFRQASLLFFGNSQMKIATLYSSSRLQRLVFLEIFYPCFEVQASSDKILEGVMKRANLRWQLYDCARQCWRKATAPTSVSQAHFQQGTMAERNLIRAGGKVTSRGANGSSFPLLLLALVVFISPEPDTSHHKRA